ncbi:choline dehydrogenase [Xylariaceae sp. FL1272]|nr:choline dehydrogenase [Xylariaceae sp. FL1272]
MDTSYDFVIIGGGTAALTIAARLSEQADFSIAVVEAGSYYQITNTLVSSTPACAVALTGTSPNDINPNVDWGFITTTQPGLDGREIHYARGKCLGGSSGRSSSGSLQRWVDLVGDESYNFKNMRPYYQKSCQFTAPDSAVVCDNMVRYQPEAFLQDGGPLQIGIPRAEDFNTGSLVGSQFCPVTIDPATALRSSAQTAFLDACQARPNIKVFRQKLAIEIIFNDKKQAVAVDTDSVLRIGAEREVILCAGAFQSPQLLMLSCIGPAEALQGLGIPIVADRPGVGRNMSEHLMFGPSYRVKVQTLPSILSDPAQMIPAAVNYFTNARGPLTSQAVDYIAFEKVPRDMISKEASETLDYHDYASIIVSPCARRSRGSMTLKSRDIVDLPLVDPNWLSDPIDAEVAIAGYKAVREIIEAIRRSAAPTFHASTICHMGRIDDPEAVVDAKAQVIGVSRLRVVDTSFSRR